MEMSSKFNRYFLLWLGVFVLFLMGLYGAYNGSSALTAVGVLPFTYASSVSLYRSVRDRKQSKTQLVQRALWVIRLEFCLLALAFVLSIALLIVLPLHPVLLLLILSSMASSASKMIDIWPF